MQNISVKKIIVSFLCFSILYFVSCINIFRSNQSNLWFYTHSDGELPPGFNLTPASFLYLNPDKTYTLDFGEFEYGKWIMDGAAVRAIESALDNNGIVMRYRGNTELFIDETYTMKVVDGLLTGFHEPKASHLNMLQSIGGYEHIDNAYREAIKAGYFWHQFGDLHLILP